MVVIGGSQGNSHQPLCTLSRERQGHPETQFQDTFPLFKCVQSVSLCHYQIRHTYFTRGDESVPFARNICLLVSHQDDLKDMARGERLSPLCTHSGLSCDHMLVWTFVPKRVFTRRERHESLVHVSVRKRLYGHMA